MMGLCIAQGTRIIVEQDTQIGQRYLMVDFSPTDNSNPEYETYLECGLVCVVSSVDHDDEGKINENFANYLDACRWLADFLRQGDFTEIYIETY